MTDREYTIRVSYAEQARVEVEADRRGITSHDVVARLAARAATALPPPAPPAGRNRRSLSEIRAQRREETGGPSSSTTEIQTLTSDRSTTP